jgi:arginine decarboxylase
MFKPRGYFLAGGVGVSTVSPLNAFDNALHDAGITNYNLVPVSSIIPEGAVEVEPRTLEKGSIVFVVISVSQGTSGDRIVAGIGWTKLENAMGMVMEYHGKNDLDVEGVKGKLREMLKEAMMLRKLPMAEPRYHLEMLEVPPEHFGCAIACLVFI